MKRILHNFPIQSNPPLNGSTQPLAEKYFAEKWFISPTPRFVLLPPLTLVPGVKNNCRDGRTPRYDRRERSRRRWIPLSSKRAEYSQALLQRERCARIASNFTWRLRSLREWIPGYGLRLRSVRVRSETRRDFNSERWELWVANWRILRSRNFVSIVATGTRVRSWPATRMYLNRDGVRACRCLETSASRDLKTATVGYIIAVWLGFVFVAARDCSWIVEDGAQRPSARLSVQHRDRIARNRCAVKFRLTSGSPNYRARRFPRAPVCEFVGSD